MKKNAAHITREYGPFPDIEGVHGVTYDGKQVWFATSEGLYTLDPTDGVVTRKHTMGADAGTAFDGRHLYQITEAVIQKIDPQTGSILHTIPAPSNGGDSGMAWAEGSLWVGEHRGCKIHQVDPDTGEVLRTISSDRFVTGVTWVEGDLWHGTWQENESDLRQIDPDTGEVLQRLDLPSGIGVSGLESDGADRFFCGGGDVGKIRVVHRPK
ncbi:hypothetical protein [Hwanghaeella sp.]|uniref:Vgb family protein n=1 Tax=Hwanghaeella sp. TaxID=2605943 RepID=UPI003CCC027B